MEERQKYNISVSFKANLALLNQLEAFCVNTHYTTSSAIRAGLALLMSKHAKRAGNTGDTSNNGFSSEDVEDDYLPSPSSFGYSE